MACEVQNLLVVQRLRSSNHVLRTDDVEIPFPDTIISDPRVEVSAMCSFNPYALLVECTILPKVVFVRTSFDEEIVNG